MIAAVEVPPAVNREALLSHPLGRCPGWCQVLRFGDERVRGPSEWPEHVACSSRARLCPWVREPDGSHGAKRTSGKAANKRT